MNQRENYTWLKKFKLGRWHGVTQNNKNSSVKNPTHCCTQRSYDKQNKVWKKRECVRVREKNPKTVMIDCDLTTAKECENDRARTPHRISCRETSAKLYLHVIPSQTHYTASAVIKSRCFFSCSLYFIYLEEIIIILFVVRPYQRDKQHALCSNKNIHTNALMLIVLSCWGSSSNGSGAFSMHKTQIYFIVTRENKDHWTNNSNQFATVMTTWLRLKTFKIWLFIAIMPFVTTSNNGIKLDA